ncbi:hypothetical protein MUG78_18025 [Gordonia alkaliphila]|uniref:hypothetical protein n=1 Tax=Gordonia alkaliphila TaxID=1053547 RepID=UPI001FF4A6E8|nr:hypothetical protein [Gordonia alkaliphila]MCK0441299.1 hypothetical protein [Gordonia alkaliphila]
MSDSIANGECAVEAGRQEWLAADRSSRTLTVGDLVAELGALDPAMPVVFEGIDEPVGDYGVRSVSVVEGLARVDTFAGDPQGVDVFKSAQHVSSGERPRADVFPAVVVLCSES